MNNVDEDLMNQIVSKYSAEQEAKADEKKNLKKPIGLEQVMEILETLKLYVKQQEKRNFNLFKEL